MPLSRPENRTLKHTRTVHCHGYKREDGCWDIEGRIVDTKPYRFANKDRGGWIEAGEALHDMSIRLTVDMTMQVQDAEAVIDHSPYNYCRGATDFAKNLIGLKIEPGWTRKSRKAMGANSACTHLAELLGPVATTAIQTINSEKFNDMHTKANYKAIIHSCYSYAPGSPVLKDLPDTTD